MMSARCTELGARVLSSSSVAVSAESRPIRS